MFRSSNLPFGGQSPSLKSKSIDILPMMDAFFSTTDLTQDNQRTEQNTHLPDNDDAIAAYTELPNSVTTITIR